MKLATGGFVFAALCASSVGHADDVAAAPVYLDRVRTSITGYLGRPYVWGATGLKSFDCSGFVWRVMADNGVLLKRTTARKLYMILKPVPPGQEGKFGTLVFFDGLTHVGIVDNATSFYHSQSRRGTIHTDMNWYWNRVLYGYRMIPVPGDAQ